MSDEDLRSSARRWRDTGSVDDGARHLIERIRRGELDMPRLLVAASSGHAAAALAARTLDFAFEQPEHLSAWAQRLPLSQDRAGRAVRFDGVTALLHEAASQADAAARAALREHAVPLPDHIASVERFLRELTIWVETSRAGNILRAPRGVRRNANSPVVLAVNATREAIDWVVRSGDRSNFPEVRLGDALVLCAEVIGDDEVRRIVASRALR